MTTPFDLIQFADSAALASTVAGRWLDELAALDSPGYCAALSGGRIAKTFFDETARQAKERAVSLAALHFFWADERCVPPTDPESNFSLAYRHLLEPLGIALDRLHRVRGEERPEFAVREAEAELCRHAPLNELGLPVLDLVFLGMGEDGHVASVFPGAPAEVLDGPRVYCHVTASKPPPERITLGLATILAARQVWVLASGPGKEGALRESLKPGGRTPLARVVQGRARTVVFCDF